MSIFYKIMTQADWQVFQAAGSYAGSTVDLADGYIHFSTAAQLMATLEKHYAGQTGLVVLAVDGDALNGDALKWEPARGGDLFPHLYEPLPLKAVRQDVAVANVEGGGFALPQDLLADD